MSLKTTHLVFILCSFLLCLGVGWWGVEHAQASSFNLTLGIISVLGALALLVYGRRFFKRSYWSERID